MGNTNISIQNTKQKVFSNTIQRNKQNCFSTSIQNDNNDVLIFTNSTISGNVAINGEIAATDATCIITSDMENYVQNTLSSLTDVDFSAETDWFNDFAVNKNTSNKNLNQTIVNNLFQVNETTCSSSTIQNRNGSFQYISGINIGGNFASAVSTADPKSTCTMDNTMKLQIYNDEAATYKDKYKSQGVFVVLIKCVALVVIVCVIAFGILILLGGGLSFITGKKNKKKDDNDNNDPESGELKTLEEVAKNKNEQQQ